jgi:hypothetical protein
MPEKIRDLRRRFARQGLIVRKLPARSRWFPQYGPFMLVDAATNAIVAARLDEDDLEAQAS